MIVITTEGRHLRIQADVAIPNAEAGQWDAPRIARLMELIEQYVEAAEMVDGAMTAIYMSDKIERSNDDRRESASC